MSESISGGLQWDQQVAARKIRIHRRISYVKSALRFVGYMLLPFHIYWAAAFLIKAELLGIAEEKWGA